MGIHSSSSIMAMNTLGPLVQQVVLLLLLGGHHVHGQEDCCAVKEVTGDDDMAGTYRLATPGDGDSFPAGCIDSCAYARDGNPNSGELFCFKTEGATHTTECRGRNHCGWSWSRRVCLFKGQFVLGRISDQNRDALIS